MYSYLIIEVIIIVFIIAIVIVIYLTFTTVTQVQFEKSVKKQPETTSPQLLKDVQNSTQKMNNTIPLRLVTPCCSLPNYG
jgi:hypothetical protein